MIKKIYNLKENQNEQFSNIVPQIIEFKTSFNEVKKYFF